MKPVRDWDEKYLLSLPHGEQSWIEFKGARSLDFTLPGVDENKVLDELSKQVSAFANSGGGTIVYGVDDAPAGKLKVISNGGIPLQLKGRSTKEWLEDVIPNMVEFQLRNFNVYTITNSDAPDSGIDKDKCVVLIEIPDSDDAPHQAVRENRYYARVGGKSRPIGHRLVMDIVGRSKHPNMIPTFYLYNSSNGIYLYAHFINKGRILAKKIVGYLYVPYIMFRRSDTDEVIEYKGKRYKEFSFRNTMREQVGIGEDPSFPNTKQKFFITRDVVILPGQWFRGHAILNKIDPIDLILYSGEIIYWKIYADNAPINKGQVRFGDIKTEAQMRLGDPIGPE